MKAILEFDLPENDYEFKVASQSQQIYSAICDIRNEVRNYHKYGKDAEKTIHAIQEICQETPEIE